MGPFIGYGVYRLISRRVPLTSGRRVLAAGIGAYVGINASALAAAIEFGIQPDLFAAADGSPLYAPFHLAQTIPAMALAHLTVAGGVEAALTAGVFAYLQRNNLPVLRINRGTRPPSEMVVGAGVGPSSEPVAPGPEGVEEVERATPEPVGASASQSSSASASSSLAPARSPWRWAAVGIGSLALLTPLGLIAEGGAFGEGAPSDLDLGRYGLNAIPSGLNRYNGFWSHTVLGDYGFSSGDNATVGYLLSAAVGVAVVGLSILAIWSVARFVSRAKGDADSGSSRPAVASGGS